MSLAASTGKLAVSNGESRAKPERSSCRRQLEEVREFFNPDLRLLGYLFTMSEPTINTSVWLQILRQAYTHQALKTVIPLNTDLRDAHFQKQDIFAFNPCAKAARAYL